MTAKDPFEQQILNSKLPKTPTFSPILHHPTPISLSPRQFTTRLSASPMEERSEAPASSNALVVTSEYFFLHCRSRTKFRILSLLYRHETGHFWTLTPSRATHQQAAACTQLKTKFVLFFWSGYFFYKCFEFEIVWLIRCMSAFVIQS